MKNRIFCIFTVSIGLLVVAASAPKNGTKHKGFITYYNASNKEPDSVSWDLTPGMLTCGDIPRPPFAADPLIPGCPGANAYEGMVAGQTYSRGHMFNYNEAKCDPQSRVECLYMSNMLPQPQQFNEGDWASVEHQERKWAALGKIHIVAGGMGLLGKLPSGVTVPDSCWKAIYHNHQWDGYIMANRSTSHGHRLGSHVASFENFKRRTKFHPSAN